MKIKTFHTWATHITLSAQFGGHGSSNYHFMGAECSQVHTSGVHISYLPQQYQSIKGIAGYLCISLYLSLKSIIYHQHAQRQSVVKK